MKKLFGIFDHDITFRNNGPVTIIHGPNGYGKTVLLRMISGVSGGNLDVFRTIPFEEFVLWFEDGQRLEVRHAPSDAPTTRGAIRGLLVELVSANGERTKIVDTLSSEQMKSLTPEILDEIDRLVPHPYTRWQTGWRNFQTGTACSLLEIIDLYPTLLDQRPLNEMLNQAKGSLAWFRRQLPTHYINTQRLEPRRIPARHYAANWSVPEDGEEDRTQSTVERYSADLAQRLESALANYARHSQQKDRSFPERLVKFIREDRDALLPEDILGRLKTLDARRSRLVEIGVLDSEQSLKDLTVDDVRRAKEALTIYVEDVADKLNVFNSVASRVGLLQDTVNKRFSYKTLKITRQGFSLASTVGNRTPIHPTDLSSGEQHELVVLYELLFQVPQSGLVLIDEPELSLHVAWQESFLEDLIEILKVIGAKAIIATHAPMVIGRRWDLTVELSGPSGSLS